MSMRMYALAVVVLIGCGNDEPAAKPEAPREMPTIPFDDEPEAAPLPTDPDRAIQHLGAVPAWEAVVQRDQYLARRGQHGVVYGRMGPEIFAFATNEPEGPTPDAAPDAAGALEPAPAATTPVPPLAPIADAQPGPVVTAVTGAAAPVAGAAPAPPGPPPPRVAEASRKVATGLHWLIDDTEGYGTLGVRVAFPGGGKPPAVGTRVAIGGAWTLGEDKRWVWKADSVSVLPAAAAAPAAAQAVSPPGHWIPVTPVPRENLRVVSKAIDNGVILFQVAAAPREEGEGWKLQDELGSPVVATLILPGERTSFGGHDMRTPDERWQLKRKVTYWVRIGKVRRKSPEEPALLNAIGAPARAW